MINIILFVDVVAQNIIIVNNFIYLYFDIFYITFVCFYTIISNWMKNYLNPFVMFVFSKNFLYVLSCFYVISFFFKFFFVFFDVERRMYLKMLKEKTHCWLIIGLCCYKNLVVYSSENVWYFRNLKNIQ